MRFSLRSTLSRRVYFLIISRNPKLSIPAADFLRERIQLTLQIMIHNPARRPAVIALLAQRVEIYGGGQYEHLQPSYNAVGWNGSLTGNFKHVLGITADFSGVYKSHRTDSSVYTYTVGPVLTARLPVIQPFVHALFGGATISGGGVSDTCVCHASWRRLGHRTTQRDRTTLGAGGLDCD